MPDPCFDSISLRVSVTAEERVGSTRLKDRTREPQFVSFPVRPDSRIQTPSPRPLMSVACFAAPARFGVLRRVGIVNLETAVSGDLPGPTFRRHRAESLGLLPGNV